MRSHDFFKLVIADIACPHNEGAAEVTGRGMKSSLHKNPEKSGQHVVNMGLLSVERLSQASMMASCALTCAQRYLGNNRQK